MEAYVGVSVFRRGVVVRALFVLVLLLTAVFLALDVEIEEMLARVWGGGAGAGAETAARVRVGGFWNWLMGRGTAAQHTTAAAAATETTCTKQLLVHVPIQIINITNIDVDVSVGSVSSVHWGVDESFNGTHAGYFTWPQKQNQQQAPHDTVPDVFDGIWPSHDAVQHLLTHPTQAVPRTLAQQHIPYTHETNTNMHSTNKQAHACASDVALSCSGEWLVSSCRSLSRCRSRACGSSSSSSSSSSWSGRCCCCVTLLPYERVLHVSFIVQTPVTAVCTGNNTLKLGNWLGPPCWFSSGVEDLLSVSVSSSAGVSYSAPVVHQYLYTTTDTGERYVKHHAHTQPEPTQQQIQQYRHHYHVAILIADPDRYTITLTDNQKLGKIHITAKHIPHNTQQQQHKQQQQQQQPNQSNPDGNSRSSVVNGINIARYYSPIIEDMRGVHNRVDPASASASGVGCSGLSPASLTCVLASACSLAHASSSSSSSTSLLEPTSVNLADPSFGLTPDSLLEWLETLDDHINSDSTSQAAYNSTHAQESGSDSDSKHKYKSKSNSYCDGVWWCPVVPVGRVVRLLLSLFVHGSRWHMSDPSFGAVSVSSLFGRYWFKRPVHTWPPWMSGPEIAYDYGGRDAAFLWSRWLRSFATLHYSPVAALLLPTCTRADTQGRWLRQRNHNTEFNGFKPNQPNQTLNIQTLHWILPGYVWSPFGCRIQTWTPQSLRLLFLRLSESRYALNKALYPLKHATGPGPGPGHGSGNSNSNSNSSAPTATPTTSDPTSSSRPTSASASTSTSTSTSTSQGYIHNQVMLLGTSNTRRGVGVFLSVLRDDAGNSAGPGVWWRMWEDNNACNEQYVPVNSSQYFYFQKLYQHGIGTTIHQHQYQQHTPHTHQHQTNININNRTYVIDVTHTHTHTCGVRGGVDVGVADTADTAAAAAADGDDAASADVLYAVGASFPLPSWWSPYADVDAGAAPLVAVPPKPLEAQDPNDAPGPYNAQTHTNATQTHTQTQTQTQTYKGPDDDTLFQYTAHYYINTQHDQQVTQLIPGAVPVCVGACGGGGAGVSVGSPSVPVSSSLLFHDARSVVDMRGSSFSSYLLSELPSWLSTLRMSDVVNNPAYDGVDTQQQGVQHVAAILLDAGTWETMSYWQNNKFPVAFPATEWSDSIDQIIHTLKTQYVNKGVPVIYRSLQYSGDNFSQPRNAVTRLAFAFWQLMLHKLQQQKTGFYIMDVFDMGRQSFGAHLDWIRNHVCHHAQVRLMWSEDLMLWTLLREIDAHYRQQVHHIITSTQKQQP